EGQRGVLPKRLLIQWFAWHAHMVGCARASAWQKRPPLAPPWRRPRGRAIGASSAYNKVARGPCARHRRWAAQRFEPETTAMLNSLDVEGLPRVTRVVVAMSGGVDSSVTAALLKAEGYDVVGVTLQLYDHGAATHRKGACCAGQDLYDARAGAGRGGTPRYVLDYESRFKEMVIDRCAESYVAGETPVPCIECNQSIKFRDLLATARELGAKVLATGHYVASRPLADGGRALYRAREE